MRKSRYLIITLFLWAAIICYLSMPTDAGFWAISFGTNQIGPTPTATATPTPTATPTGTPTATPTPGGLPAAITAMLSDVGNGATNPIPTLCAASSVSTANGGSTSGTCTQAGSVNVASIPHDGTDAGPALQTAINAGDVNLPAFTYTINTAVNVPSYRTIQCQPGAVLTTTQTTIHMLNFNNVQSDTVVGCTLTGPGSVGTLNASYAAFLSGGQNIHLIGNTVSGWPSASAVTVNSGTRDVLELNQFSGNHDNGLNISGTATHIMSGFNELNTVITPAIPTITNSGGTKLQRDLWTILAALGASGTPAAAGYSLVQPGASFGGHTCTMNGVADDTQCVVSALAAAGSTSGIIVAPGTGGTPWLRIGTSDAIQGANLTNKTILCEPGARFYYPGNQGTGSNPVHMIIMGAGFGASSGSNINFVGCQFFGDYTNPPTTAGNHYNEMIQMANDSTTGNITGLGLDMEDCYGDCWIPYSNSTSATSGPNDITLMLSNMFQSNQPTIHVNGGQGIHLLFIRTGDADADDEVDVDNTTNLPRQIEVADWDNIYNYSINGVLDNIDESWQQPSVSCSGRQDAGANEGGCFMHDVVADGANALNPGASGGKIVPNVGIHISVVNGSGNSQACIPGTYAGATILNGAVIESGHC